MGCFLSPSWEGICSLRAFSFQLIASLRNDGKRSLLGNYKGIQELSTFSIVARLFWPPGKATTVPVRTGDDKMLEINTFSPEQTGPVGSHDCKLYLRTLT